MLTIQLASDAASAANQVTSYSISRFRNDTVALPAKLVDSAGAAVDITDYTFRLTVDPSKAPLNTDNNIYTLTGTVIEATSGRFDFAVTPTDSLAAAGKYNSDIEMTFDPGDGSVVQTIARGAWTIIEDITK